MTNEEFARRIRDAREKVKATMAPMGEALNATSALEGTTAEQHIETAYDALAKAARALHGLAVFWGVE